MSQTMKKDAPEHAGGDLSALRERVEGATGPDRELDIALARHFGLVPPDKFPLPWELSLTASIDAALALVERKLPGTTYAIDASAPDLGIDVDFFGPNASSHGHKGTGKTLPLAILSALLTALEQQP